MMKKFFKRAGIILLVAFLIIQLFRPEKNVSVVMSPTDITTRYEIPEPVMNILKVACYDCHSNNTRYPWYAEIQPIAWWLADHVHEGKHELNFSEFTSYRIRKQLVRFEQTVELVREEEMPLKSYKWAHKDARLSAEQKQLIQDWAEGMQDTIRARYPADSLVKK